MAKYPFLKEFGEEEYKALLQKRDFVVIEGKKVKLIKRWRIKRWGPPEDYQGESTTVWSFPNRGDWATHRGDYRGNWSPFIPRNIILRYSKEGEWILDQMCGSGTTLVEAKLLGRNAIGVDISEEAILLTRNRLDFAPPLELFKSTPPPEIKTFVGDARFLRTEDGKWIRDESIDLVLFHPPYANIIGYSKSTIEGDLSSLRRLSDYLKAMKEVAEEAWRVLKPGRYCAILIGDTRRHRHYVPIAFKVMSIFLDVGFVLKEDIIKLQWNTERTNRFWRNRERDFYLIMHEHLFVFRKPEQGENLRKFKESMK